MNCAGDRLTAICSGAAQEAASRQASRNIHSPISTIRPLSSAIGMKSPGDTKPRTGCSQRASASKPITSLSATVAPDAACGW